MWELKLKGIELVAVSCAIAQIHAQLLIMPNADLLRQ